MNRRTMIRVAGTAAAATAGLATVGSAAAEHECPCHQCWLDIKPGSCPNSVDPDSNGVVSVAAGWPALDPDSVVLVPREKAWGDCSERRSDYEGPDCETAEDRLDGDHAEAVRAERQDVDEDGDADWVFKFEKGAVGFEAGVQSAVLVGRDEESGCVVWGVDSINIVGGNGTGDGASDNGNGNGDSASDNGNRGGGRGRGRGR